MQALAIGISGKIGSGKDTMADTLSVYITDHFGLTRLENPLSLIPVKKSFAGVLKEEATNAILSLYQYKNGFRVQNLPVDMRNYLEKQFGTLTNVPEILTEDIIRGMMEDRTTKEYFRKLLQWWETDLRRIQFGDDYWTSLFRSQVEEEIKFNRIDDKTFLVFIVPDIRFVNEADCIHKMGGILVRMSRPRYQNTGDHSSETSLDDYDGFDFLIINNGTRFDLVSHCGDIVEKGIRRLKHNAQINEHSPDQEGSE